MSPEEITELNEALANWRQGDAVLGDAAPPFIFLADMRCPLSKRAQEQAGKQAGAGTSDIDVVDTAESGLAIVSQTCDIVRPYADRPYVEVCPLVAPSSDALGEILRGRRPQFAALRGLVDRGLVVDLDRTMTIEKAVLLPLTSARVIGVQSEQEARTFADAAARKRNRAALPGAFGQGWEPVRKRILGKHGKESPEGRFLAGVLEIRVRPNPSWAADVKRVEALFVYERLGDIPEDADEHIEALLARFIASDAYPLLTGRAASLDTMTAADYLESDRLDLEHLSLEGA